MSECDRCGIPMDARGLCVDCAEVEGTRPAVRTAEKPIRDSRYVITSSRRGFMPPDERERLCEQVGELTARLMSANEIAARIGVSTRTVVRYRRRLGIETPHSSPIVHVRDMEAFRAAARASLERSRRKAS